MSKDIDYPLVVIKNEDVEASSLISLHGNNNEDYEKQDMVIDIYFEAIFHSIKKSLFHQRMVDFFSELYFSDQKYQTNGTVRDENYKLKLSFTRNFSVSFGTDNQ